MTQKNFTFLRDIISFNLTTSIQHLQNRREKRHGLLIIIISSPILIRAGKKIDTVYFPTKN